MHFVFGLRGHKKYADEFINELSTRYVPFKKYNKETKKLEDKWIQMRVCPVQLWDVSFPEDHLDTVLNTILKGGKGMSANKHIDRLAWLPRKAFRLKPIPDYKTDLVLPMQQPEHLDILAIGIKEDKWLTEDGRVVDKKDKTELSYEGI